MTDDLPDDLTVPNMIAMLEAREWLLLDWPSREKWAATLTSPTPFDGRNWADTRAANYGTPEEIQQAAQEFLDARAALLPELKAANKLAAYPKEAERSYAHYKQWEDAATPEQRDAWIRADRLKDERSALYEAAKTIKRGHLPLPGGYHYYMDKVRYSPERFPTLTLLLQRREEVAERNWREHNEERRKRPVGDKEWLTELLRRLEFEQGVEAGRILVHGRAMRRASIA